MYQWWWIFYASVMFLEEAILGCLQLSFLARAVHKLVCFFVTSSITVRFSLHFPFHSFFQFTFFKNVSSHFFSFQVFYFWSVLVDVDHFRHNTIGNHLIQVLEPETDVQARRCDSAASDSRCRRQHRCWRHRRRHCCCRRDSWPSWARRSRCCCCRCRCCWSRHCGWTDAPTIALPVAQLCHPGVYQDVLGVQSLVRLFPEQAPDETLGPGRQGVWKTEVSSPDLGKQSGVLLSVEGVPEIRKESDLTVSTWSPVWSMLKLPLKRLD